MKQYKLINNKTKEEHFCDKVTIDRFDYYVSDDIIEEGWKGTAYKEDVKGKIFKHFYTTNEWYKDAKKVIATTNNPNIDIPKVVDIKLLKHKIAEIEYPSGKRERKHTEQEAFVNGWRQCLQSQETHPFSGE